VLRRKSVKAVARFPAPFAFEGGLTFGLEAVAIKARILALDRQLGDEGGIRG
jgi:hypothetical protein